MLERLKPEGDEKEATYHVRHLERVRNVPYPQIVSKTTEIMHSPALAGNAAIVVDQTGVGAPVVAREVDQVAHGPRITRRRPGGPG